MKYVIVCRFAVNRCTLMPTAQPFFNNILNVVIDTTSYYAFSWVGTFLHFVCANCIWIWLSIVNCFEISILVRVIVDCYWCGAFCRCIIGSHTSRLLAVVYFHILFCFSMYLFIYLVLYTSLYNKSNSTVKRLVMSIKI